MVFYEAIPWRPEWEWLGDPEDLFEKKPGNSVLLLAVSGWGMSDSQTERWERDREQAQRRGDKGKGCGVRVEDRGITQHGCGVLLQPSATQGPRYWGQVTFRANGVEEGHPSPCHLRSLPRG